MAKMTYSVIDAGVLDSCYDCSEPADMILVADTPDEAGHTDEIPLCLECAKDWGVD